MERADGSGRVAAGVGYRDGDEHLLERGAARSARLERHVRLARLVDRQQRPPARLYRRH